MTPLPPPRLLERLDAEIAAEPNPLRADILRAERAAYLARQGRDVEAKAVLAELHKRYDLRPDVEVSAWVSLVESLLSYLWDMGPNGPDKMRRCHALSRAARLVRLNALSAAWLAQMDYNRFDIELMASHVGESLSLAAPDHHSARSRASLVVAQALHLAGQMELAEPWYKRARAHAVAEGDEATTSAWMHNMAWLRMHMHRQEVLVGVLAGKGGSHALMGLESTIEYDFLQGIATLETLKPVLRAQVLALEGKPDRALRLFDNYIAAQPQGMARLQCTLQADRAWCLAELKRMDEALDAAIAAEGSFEPDTQVDDRAVTHSRLAQIYRIAGDTASFERHSLLAKDCWDQFAKVQERILVSLKDLTESGPPRIGG